jgi:hypothetical protein
MKKTFTILLFELIIIVFNVQSQDVFNNKIDTLLVQISKLIVNDLKNDSTEISSRPWIGFGDSFELKVIFNAKQSWQLTCFHRPDSLWPKYSKWRLSHFLKRDYFRSYIYENDELPYNMFECFNYKFMQLIIKGDSINDAIYGEYRFSANSKGLTILDKNVKIIKGRQAIVDKQLSKW